MTGFGDADPEDSWDPDDPVAELVDNIRRRLLAVVVSHATDARLRRRMTLAADDIAHIIDRIEDRILDRVEH